MSVLVSSTNMNLSAATWYRSDANNPLFINGGASTTLGQPLTSYQTIPLTFASGGKCMGVILGITYGYSSLQMYSTTVDRGVRVTLQEVKTPVTMTIASPCVVTFAGHGFSGGEEIVFSTTGALPTGITAGTYYFVKYIDANTFNISLTSGGTNINTSGTQSGTHSLWAVRATKTLSHSDIWSPLTRPVGTMAMDFSFGTGYTIDTTASKWRLQMTQTGTSGTLYLIRSDSTTNIAYITYSDNLVSASSGNDMLVAKDVVTIDQSFTLKAYTGTGYTTQSCCAIACKSPQTNVDDIAMFQLLSPASSYTLTFDGPFMISTWSGFRAGTEASRIPIANKFTISQPRTPTAGAVGSSGFYHFRGGFEALGMGLWLYGEDPGYLHATLTADCNVGATSCTVDDGSRFLAGDLIQLGKENVAGGGNATLYTISSVAGNTLNFSPAIAGANRLTGGTVVRMPANMGIEMKCDVANGSTNSIGGPAALTVKGVKLDYVNFQATSGGYLWTESSQDMVFYRCVRRGSSTVANITSGIFTGANQTITYEEVHGLVTTSGFLNQTAVSLVLNNQAFSSGKFTFKNCHLLKGYTQGFISCSGLIEMDIQGCSYENWVQGYGFTLSGVNLIFKNNFVWGDPGTSAYGAVILQNLFSVSDWSSNVFDKNWNAIYFNSGYLIKGFSTNDTFGQTTANTYDLQLGANASIDWQFNNPTLGTGTDFTFTGVPMTQTLAGSEIRITNYDGTTNRDYIYTYNGDLARCGDSLSDTTVHTSGTGAFSLRQESKISTRATTWTQTIPTGNIQNRDAMVGVWVKINSASYYGGSVYEMPRLVLNYDNGTETYAEATTGTGWQFLKIPFRPTTTYGQITISVTSRTDATGSNAYVYIDDFSMLYPSGYTLNLGSLDLFADARPVGPAISTSVSALDVWAADPTIFGAGTIGKFVTKLLTVAKFIGLK